MVVNITGLHEDQQPLQEMWAYVSDKLLEAIPLEPDAEVSAIMMDSLCKVRKEDKQEERGGEKLRASCFRVVLKISSAGGMFATICLYYGEIDRWIPEVLSY